MSEEMKYEDAIAELTAIVEKLSGGNVSLDDSIKLYARGVELSSFCDKKLNEIECKISVLNKTTLEEEEYISEETRK